MQLNQVFQCIRLVHCHVITIKSKHIDLNKNEIKQHSMNPRISSQQQTYQLKRKHLSNIARTLYHLRLKKHSFCSHNTLPTCLHSWQKWYDASKQYRTKDSSSIQTIETYLNVDFKIYGQCGSILRFRCRKQRRGKPVWGIKSQ